MGQLAPTAIPAKEALGVETIQTTADRGYFQGEDNLLRAVNIVGVQKLVEALRRRAFAEAIRRIYGSRGWSYARVFARIVYRAQNFVVADLLA